MTDAEERSQRRLVPLHDDRCREEPGQDIADCGLQPVHSQAESLDAKSVSEPVNDKPWQAIRFAVDEPEGSGTGIETLPEGRSTL